MKERFSDRASYVYTGGKPLHPAAPAVVFVHGAAQDHSCWALQSRWFAHHGYAVLAPDLPGHGRSEGPPLQSVAGIADWLAALLDACDIGRAIVVGHSMGALAALELAGRHPEHVARLALIGCSVPMPVSAGLLEAAAKDEPQAVAMINDWSYSPQGQLGASPIPGTWLPGANRRLMERQPPGALHCDLAACNVYVDGEKAAAAVAARACPTLIVAGSRDRMTPARNTQALARMLPHAITVTLPGAGHAMMAEQPDGLLDALIGFSRG